MRLFATDQFCKSLAVISCLELTGVSEDRVRSSRLLSAVGELPPKLTQRGFSKMNSVQLHGCADIRPVSAWFGRAYVLI
jgi:hypothetical protein